MNNDSDESLSDLLTELDLTSEDTSLLDERPGIMLSVEDSFGQYWAFAYAHLRKVRLNFGQTRLLELFFSDSHVKITGICLEALYRDVCQHRAVRIRETSKSGLLTAVDGELVIQIIDVEEAA